jgi:DinB family protein
MNTREYLGARLKAEHKAFKRVLEALPADRLDYKPHERSPDARSLVFTLAAEFACCVDIARSGRYDWQMTPPPPLPEMIALFDRSHRELLERLATLDDAAWERPVQLYFGGQLALEQPLGEFLWGILFDTIHHRGQLSAYLRPMGGKVPSIYGPSADDPGQ